jgi:hypothetical protein
MKGGGQNRRRRRRRKEKKSKQNLHKFERNLFFVFVFVFEKKSNRNSDQFQESKICWLVKTRRIGHRWVPAAVFFGRIQWLIDAEKIPTKDVAFSQK